MDHIPLPRDPVRSPPRIRYYCLEEYDRGDFNTYPERQGWTQTELFTYATWTNVFRAGGRAAFLQQWLFFGLLHATFGDAIVFQDYIDEESGTKYIHTRNLLLHADQLILKRDSGLVTENDMYRLDRSLQTAYIACQFIAGVRESALDPYFVLSLSLLGRFMTCLQRVCFQDSYRMPPIYRAVWSPPLVRTNHQTDVLEYEMMEQGWCPTAVHKSQQLFGLEYRYFTSFLSNVQKGECHHRVCTETQCLAFQIQKSSYRTVHTNDGCNCHFRGFKETALEMILETGDLPLVAWDRHKKVVDLIPGRFDTKYVAISHVWSDGLGNPHENTMPSCQLQTLNKLVQSLYRGKGGPIPFWIDTLCCPANSSNGKRMAIWKMRDTYAYANKVLVLDNALRSMEVTGRSVAELAFYIRSSNWSSRLWTFQEGVLPETLIFQFLNATLDSEEIADMSTKLGSGFTNGWRSPLDLLEIYTSIRGPSRRSVQPYKPPTMTLGDCFKALATRTTSNQEDESLCLASLMAIDPAILLSVNPQDRMMHFWGQLPRISERWMYYEYPRLDSVGFRWAPKTLLGIEAKASSTDTNASPTKDGLLVIAYSITLGSLSLPLSHSIAAQAWIRGTGGDWRYHIAKTVEARAANGYEHFTIPEGHFSRIALLMTSKIFNSRAMPLTTFVMVFVTDEHDGVTYARRGDPGVIYDANHPGCQGDNLHAFQLSRREDMLGGKSNRVTREGNNYLVDNDYNAVVGDWTDKKSRWCID